MKNILSWLQEEKQMRLKGGLYHQTQIKFCYNSNHIEGSRLTEDQTRYIFETNTIGLENNETANVDDIIEAVNHFHSFDYLLTIARETLTENVIKEFHRILKTGTSDSRKDWFKVGDYKTRPNIVGDIETTHPAKVQKVIQELLKEYNSKEQTSFEDIVAFHHRFERIHPFQDGNGRVGRLVMFKECLKNNITPFIIDEQHKLFYYRGLKEFDKTPGYLLDTCRSAQDAYTEMIKYFEDKNE